MTFLPQPKTRPHLIDKRQSHAERDAIDEAENAIARVRANGQCEIFVVSEGRCKRRDNQTHHMIFGIGRKKIGRSLLADHKQRTCTKCHDDITGHVLKVLSEGRLPTWTDAYERVA